MNLKKNKYSRPFTVCIVAPFPPRKGGVTVQTVLLEKFLNREEVKVIRVNTTMSLLENPMLKPLKIIIQPLYIFFRLLFILNKCDAIQLQTCSYWGFLPAAIGVPLATLYKKQSVIFYMGGLGSQFFDKYRWFVKPIFHSASIFAACSTPLVKEFEHREIKTKLLNNIFDSDLFKFRKRKKISPKLIWTRTFTNTYNPMMAIRSFELIKKEYPDATLTMTSNGSLKEEVEKYIKKNSIKDIFLPGYLSPSSLAKKVSEADIWINTSRCDGLPTSILEAAMAGLAIVTTPAGGIPDVFKNDSVRFVNNNDHQSMANAVLDILEKPKISLLLGINANHIAAQFTWDHEWPKLQKFYNYNKTHNSKNEQRES